MLVDDFVCKYDDQLVHQNLAKIIHLKKMNSLRNT